MAKTKTSIQKSNTQSIPTKTPNGVSKKPSIIKIASKKASSSKTVSKKTSPVKSVSKKALTPTSSLNAATGKDSPDVSATDGPDKYMFECAKTSRAKCKACKEIIHEGSVKHCSACEVKGHLTYSSRHVHCVTHRIKMNMIKALGSLENVKGYGLLDSNASEFLAALEK
jgi:hypothetical protein